MSLPSLADEMELPVSGEEISRLRSFSSLRWPMTETVIPADQLALDHLQIV